MSVSNPEKGKLFKQHYFNCRIYFYALSKFQSDDSHSLIMHRFIFVNICQQMLAIAMFLLLQTTTIGAQESLQAVMETLNNNVLFNETPLSEIRADSTTSCSPETNTVRAPILHKVKGSALL